MTDMISPTNPLNIRYSERNNWLGQDKPVKGFCTFTSKFFGIRAALKIISNYGCISLKDLISRWCPVGDGNNNPDKYLLMVVNMLADCQHTVNGSYRCVWSSRPVLVYHLVKAMAKVETGVHIWPDEFDEAYRLFLTGKADIFDFPEYNTPGYYEKENN